MAHSRSVCFLKTCGTRCVAFLVAAASPSPPGRANCRRSPRFLVFAGLAVMLAGSSPGTRALAAGQAASWVAQGFELLSRNDVTAAEAAFRRALETQPELAPAHRGMGLALLGRGDTAGALRELKVAAQLDPADTDAQYDLGKLAWTLSLQPGSAQGVGAKTSAADYQNLAITAMTKAAALDPGRADIHLSLAELYLEAQRAPDAWAEAEDAVRLDASNPAAHLLLGRANFARGEEDKAEAEFKAALALDPGRGDAHLDIGQLRLFQRRFPAAEAEFRQAIRVSPNLARAYEALGDLLAAAGHPAEARDVLEKAAALDPTDWHSQYRLATLLMEKGEVARAAEELETVSRLRPDFLPAREQMGLALLRRGDLKGALAAAEALEGANPQAVEGHRLMALALWKQRDYEASLAECAMALADDPEPARMLALQALELWQDNQKKEAQRAFVQAAKAEPKVGTAEVFCRLLICDGRDLGAVEDFLRKNRWVLAPRQP